MCEADGLLLLREEARGVLDTERSRVRRGARPERVARGDAVDVDDGERIIVVEVWVQQPRAWDERLEDVRGVVFRVDGEPLVEDDLCLHRRAVLC